MYFSGQSHNTARTLQDILGRYSYEDESGNKTHTRNLMEADEIRMIPKDKAIILIGSEKPIFATLAPYYTRWWLRMRAEIKPPVMAGVGIGNKVEYV
jgi:type IV secretory pathway TraG/TraD family ATPase VirD4